MVVLGFLDWVELTRRQARPAWLGPVAWRDTGFDEHPCRRRDDGATELGRGAILRGRELVLLRRSKLRQTMSKLRVESQR
jgi:hypothetical protein